MFAEVALPLGRAIAMLTLVGIVGDVRQQMRTHMLGVFAEMLARLPPAQKGNGANRPVRMLLEKMFIKELGLGEGLVAADPLTAVLLLGGSRADVGDSARDIVVAVLVGSRPVYGSRWIRSCGGLDQHKLLSQLNEGVCHTLRISSAPTVLFSLAALVMCSCTNVRKPPTSG
jgi:hypothetical protein